MKKSQLRQIIREELITENSLDKLISKASPTILHKVAEYLTRKRISSGDKNFRNDKDGGKKRFLSYLSKVDKDEVEMVLKQALNNRKLQREHHIDDPEGQRQWIHDNLDKCEDPIVVEKIYKYLEKCLGIA